MVYPNRIRMDIIERLGRRTASFADKDIFPKLQCSLALAATLACP